MLNSYLVFMVSVTSLFELVPASKTIWGWGVPEAPMPFVGDDVRTVLCIDGKKGHTAEIAAG